VAWHEGVQQIWETMNREHFVATMTRKVPSSSCHARRVIILILGFIDNRHETFSYRLSRELSSQTIRFSLSIVVLLFKCFHRRSSAVWWLCLTYQVLLLNIFIIVSTLDCVTVLNVVFCYHPRARFISAHRYPGTDVLPRIATWRWFTPLLLAHLLVIIFLVFTHFGA
jgi:hypothetical protein